MQNANVKDNVAREEACAIICKIMNEDAIEEEICFADSGDITSWAKGYVSALAKKKVFIGFPDNTFKPKSFLTKAELLTALSRVEGVGGPT